MKPIRIRGFEVYKSYLDAGQQQQIVADMRMIVDSSPMFSPTTRFGKPMSVKMTSAGKYGWYSDAKGYRYVDKHPNGSDWLPIPLSVLSIWNSLIGDEHQPDCCLMNLYTQNAKMGLHQDRDETDFSHPVLSISLGTKDCFALVTPPRGGQQKVCG